MGLVVSSATFASAAVAAPPSQPPADAAIGVYVEQIPTASGSVAVGGGTGKHWKLPAKAQHQIQKEGGSDTAALEQLATSSDYGSPPPPRRVPRAASPATAPSVPTNVPGDGNAGRLLVIVLLLVLTTAVVATRRIPSANRATRASQ